jgi:hypothetical protein
MPILQKKKKEVAIFVRRGARNIAKLFSSVSWKVEFVSVELGYLVEVYFAFFGDTWVWTQSFTLARQALLPLDYSSSLPEVSFFLFLAEVSIQSLEAWVDFSMLFVVKYDRRRRFEDSHGIHRAQTYKLFCKESMKDVARKPFVKEMTRVTHGCHKRLSRSQQ